MTPEREAKLRACAEEIANCLIGLPGLQEIDEIAMTLRRHNAFPSPPEIAGRMSDQTCPMCGGSGKRVLAAHGSPSDPCIGGDVIRKPCPDCKGTGRVPAQEQPAPVTADAHAEIARLREALDAKHEREESEISAIVEERDRLRGELAEAREDRDFAIGREHSALDSLRRACDERNALTAELADTTKHNERLADEYAALEKELDCQRTQMEGEASDEIARLTAELAEAQSKCERLLLEAQIHHGEDAGHKASLIECYKAVGSNAADWNGSRPVREYVERMEKELAEARDHAECWRLFRAGLKSDHRKLMEAFMPEMIDGATPEAAIRAAAKAMGIEP